MEYVFILYMLQATDLIFFSLNGNGMEGTWRNRCLFCCAQVSRNKFMLTIWKHFKYIVLEIMSKELIGIFIPIKYWYFYLYIAYSRTKIGWWWANVSLMTLWKIKIWIRDVLVCSTFLTTAHSLCCTQNAKNIPN